MDHPGVSMYMNKLSDNKSFGPKGETWIDYCQRWDISHNEMSYMDEYFFLR